MGRNEGLVAAAIGNRFLCVKRNSGGFLAIAIKDAYARRGVRILNKWASCQHGPVVCEGGIDMFELHPAWQEKGAGVVVIKNPNHNWDMVVHQFSFDWRRSGLGDYCYVHFSQDQMSRIIGVHGFYPEVLIRAESHKTFLYVDRINPEFFRYSNDPEEPGSHYVPDGDLLCQLMVGKVSEQHVKQVVQAAKDGQLRAINAIVAEELSGKGINLRQLFDERDRLVSGYSQIQGEYDQVKLELQAIYARYQAFRDTVTNVLHRSRYLGLPCSDDDKVIKALLTLADAEADWLKHAKTLAISARDYLKLSWFKRTKAAQQLLLTEMEKLNRKTGCLGTAK